MCAHACVFCVRVRFCRMVIDTAGRPAAPSFFDMLGVADSGELAAGGADYDMLRVSRDNHHPPAAVNCCACPPAVPSGAERRHKTLGHAGGGPCLLQENFRRTSRRLHPDKQPARCRPVPFQIMTMTPRII